MTNKINNPDQHLELGSHDPSSVRDLGSRISQVISRYKTLISAAKAAGISTDQLSRYVSGKSQPKLKPIGNLVEKVGVSLDWLWFGEDQLHPSEEQAAPAPAALDIQLLSVVISGVEEALDASDRMMTPDDKAELVSAVYELYIGSGKTVEKTRILRLVKSTT